MKRKLLIIGVICTLLLCLLPACEARNMGSLKSITRPYIAQYECISATYGNENLLEKFDYIEINIADKSELEIIYKPKNGSRKILTTNYEIDNKTRELTAEIGILGCKIKQTTKVENGKFTISKTIGTKQLIMNFQQK